MGNFEFLKKTDKDLFKLIDDAEKLYRDEYFEQCITQTRRFAENITRKILSDSCSREDSFDKLISKLKEVSSNNDVEKEFIEDLYYIKREGNISTHSENSKKNGIAALECLKRAFEIAINYCISQKQCPKTLLRTQYDINLLVLDKKMPKKRLVDEYLERSDYKKNKSQNKEKSSKKTKDKSTEKLHVSTERHMSLKTKFLIFTVIFFAAICLFFFFLGK